MSEYNEELTYKLFRDEKAIGRSGAFMVAYFGSRDAARFELRYQAEKAAGLITTVFIDDAVGCGTCGKKHCICQPMRRSDWMRELR